MAADGADFSASSWTQLTLTLCSVEKEIGVIRMKADERIGKEAARMKLVAARRRELEEKHNALVDERVAEYNTQVENLKLMAEKEIAEHVAQKEKADARIETARRCAENAEAHAKELEKEVKRLYGMLDDVNNESERQLAALRQDTDDNVQKKLQDCNQLVRETGLYASEVQSGVISVMSDMATETRLKIRDLDQVSKTQSRFKELYDMSRTRKADTPEAEFNAAKGDILEAWHDSWLQVAKSAVKPPDSPGFRSLSLPVSSCGSPSTLLAAEDILGTVTRRAPSPQHTERSKERALSRAAEHQRRRPIGNRQEAGDWRPRTAP